MPLEEVSSIPISFDMKPERPPENAILQLISGAVMQQALCVVTRLGVPDLVAERPQTAEELAGRTRTHAGALYRLLRALATAGVFAEVEDRTFSLTPSAELLCTGVPGSLRDLVIFMGEEWHWRIWADMLYSVETGQPAWKHVHGAEVFPWFSEHPEAHEIFNRAMTSFSYSSVSAVVDAYDFTEISTLIDIAGGHGALLTGILKSNPRLKGVLFDQPSVIDGASKMLQRAELQDRVELAAGDFFKSVPTGGDAYLMKFIIHDWDDERALKILHNIHRVIPRHGKLLLVEMVVPPGNRPHFSKIMDLQMLISPGGLERTASEYEALFERAAFRLTRIIPTRSPLCIIEGVKTEAQK
ncbi:MAG TPA: methyltransferase [Blastocatellia bacterium]|nr:methyltransferase [Blastocatellia bacterium]